MTMPPPAATRRFRGLRDAPGDVSIAAAPTLQLEDHHSIDASQLYQAAAHAAIHGEGSRKARARLIVPPAQIEEALQLTAQGKITAKNAWSVKLIEGMKDTLGSCMQDEADQYAQFTKAAHVVEGGAKIWTHRVDSAYLLSTQMVKRLLRNDTRQDAEDAEAEDGGKDGAQPARRRRKPLERTLADNAEEINADGSPSLSAQYLAGSRGDGTGSERPLGEKGAMAAHGALFRAVTEKFDQGHAQGLLVNNTRVGVCGNMVLDRDYGRDAASTGGSAAVSDIVLPVFDLGTGATVTGNDLQLAAARLAEESSGLNRAAAAAGFYDFADEPPISSRAPSVHPNNAARSRAASEAKSAANLPRGGEDDDDADFGGWDGGADEDDFIPGDEMPAAGSAFDRANAVRDYVDGRAALDEIDEHFSAAIGTGAQIAAALAAEGPGSWVPLSQHVAVRHQRRGALNAIRSACAPRDAAGDDADMKAATKKARRERKAVQFIGVPGPGSEQVNVSEDALKPDVTLLIDVKNQLQILTTAGRKFFATGSKKEDVAQYVNAEFARKRAAANHLLLPDELYDALPDWCGARFASHSPTVDDYFQPFSASTPHWNLLRKTVVMSGAVGQVPANNAGFEAMPMFVDAVHDDDDGFGGDGFAAADDPDDAVRAVDFWQGAAAADAGEADELAPLVDDAEGIELIAAPEVLPALKVSCATAPSNVDVAKLRSYMWRRTTALSARHIKKSFPVSTTAAGGATNSMAVGRTMFSDVITSLLPDVSSITKDGSLSPAFFFFSLLFLANEHNLDLRQVVGTEQLEAATRGEDLPGDTVMPDDDAPLMGLGGPRHYGVARPNPTRVVERVGCDIIINVPQTNHAN